MYTSSTSIYLPKDGQQLLLYKLPAASCSYLCNCQQLSHRGYQQLKCKPKEVSALHPRLQSHQHICPCLP